MADHRHEIDLCPDCDGLRTVRMDRLRGVTGFTLNSTEGDEIASGYDVKVYVGPVPGPCPNVGEAADGG